MTAKIQDFLNKMKALQTSLLNFLDSEEEEDFSDSKLNLLIKEYEIHNKEHELKSFLTLIVKVANHHSYSNLLNKVIQLVLSFKNEISKFYSNFEIFNLFKSNKYIILVLIKEKIITIDEDIFDLMKKYKNGQRYADYFLPETYKYYKPEKVNKLLDTHLYKYMNYSFILFNSNGDNSCNSNDDNSCNSNDDDSCNSKVNDILMNQFVEKRKIKDNDETQNKSSLLLYIKYSNYIKLYYYYISNTVIIY